MARFYGVQWMVTDFCQFKVAVKTRNHLSSRMPTCPLVLLPGHTKKGAVPR